MSKLVIVEQHDCEYFAFFCIYKRDIMQLYKATLRNVVNTTISSSWVVNICPHLQGFWSLSLNLWYLFLDTLESGINVGLRLLIF